MLKEIADRLRDKKKIILVHGNADVDAVGSAFALAITFPTADIWAMKTVPEYCQESLVKRPGR